MSTDEDAATPGARPAGRGTPARPAPARVTAARVTAARVTAARVTAARVTAARVAALGVSAALLTGCGIATTGAAGPAVTSAASPAAPTRPAQAPGDDAEPSGERTPAPRPAPTPTSSPPTPTPAPPPDPTPDPTPAPSEPAPSEPAPQAASPAAPPEPAPAPQPPPAEPEPGPLRRGDEGPAVLELQQRLASSGYFLTATDGRFGAETQQAVWALQKAAGLARDGLVGPATQAALDAGTLPVPRTGAGRVIEVDLDRQLVLAVDDGVVTRVLNASSGNGERYVALGRPQRAVTPTGDYRVIREIDGRHESTLGLGSMYRPKFFRGGWAVHGSDSVPPWPASHGCVRVSDAAMDWIWDVWGAPRGTRVLVH